MQRTTGSGFVSSLPAPTNLGAGGYFADGQVVVPAQWLNGVQEELISVINAGGETPTASANNQVLNGINNLIVDSFSNQSFGGGVNVFGYQVLPGGLIIQWGETVIYNSPQNVTFPIAFPNACLSVITCEGNANTSTWNSDRPTLHGVSNMSKTHYQGWTVIFQTPDFGVITTGTSQNFIAIGY